MCGHTYYPPFETETSGTEQWEQFWGKTAIEMSSLESQPRTWVSEQAVCLPQSCACFSGFAPVGNMKFCCHPFQCTSTGTGGGVDFHAYAQACVG